MKAIEEYKPELEGVLPKDEYFRLTRDDEDAHDPEATAEELCQHPGRRHRRSVRADLRIFPRRVCSQRRAQRAASSSRRAPWCA